MPFNPYIAQGVRPIGSGLIDVQGAVNRNALANREMANREADMGLAQRQYEDQQARLGQQDQAAAQASEAERANAILDNVIKYVNQNPKAIPQVVRDLARRGLVTGVPEDITLEQINAWAASRGAEVPQAAVPFEQSDKFKELTLRGQQDTALERLRQQGQAEADARKAPAAGAVPQEGERVAANYFGRMQEAEGKLGQYQPTFKDYAAATMAMSGGAFLSPLANTAVSGEGQKYYQAAADWVRAKLRKESGAVIAPSEMAQEIKTYFPMPGDKPETITQKAEARKQALAGMEQMGGRVVTPGAVKHIKVNAQGEVIGN